jgi:hypothetical protein
MSDSAVPYLNPPTTSLSLDAESATTAEGTVIRERVVEAGPQSNGDGHLFSTSPGTAINLPANTCRYVVITASQVNQDVVVVGSSAVVAGSSGNTGRNRRGIALFPNQQVTLKLDNMSQLWLDVVSSDDGIEYEYFV